MSKLKSLILFILFRAGTYDKGDADFSASVLSTMDWATMTYTKLMLTNASADGGHTQHIMLVNKCKGER